MSDPVEPPRTFGLVGNDAAEHVRKIMLERMDGLADGDSPDAGRALYEAVTWVTEPQVGHNDAAPKLHAILAAFELLASEIYLALATDRVQLELATRTITSGADFPLSNLARDIAAAHIEEMRREGRDLGSTRPTG